MRATSIESKSRYLGESDQCFSPPQTPRPVQVSYRLPPETTVAAAYIQVPELYSDSEVNLHVNDASLVPAGSAPRPIRSS